MILSEQQQLETFRKAPLVMNFLSSKFTQGLPDIIDTAGVLRNKDQLRQLKKNGLFLDLVLKLKNPKRAVLLLQGADVRYRSLTFWPGAQFIVAGMVSAPDNYYRIPAMRMALDFVVYIGMIVALSYLVLFPATAGSVPGNGGIMTHPFSFSESACALVFIAVSACQTSGGYLADTHLNRSVLVVQYMLVLLCGLCLSLCLWL